MVQTMLLSLTLYGRGLRFFYANKKFLCRTHFLSVVKISGNSQLAEVSWKRLTWTAASIHELRLNYLLFSIVFCLDTLPYQVKENGS